MNKQEFYDYAIEQLQTVVQDKSLTRQEIVVRRLAKQAIGANPEMVPRLNEVLRVIKYQQELA
jgi:hypothetical protein